MTPEAQRIAIAEACGKSVEAFRFWRQGHSDTEWKESPHYTSAKDAEYWREKESHWGDTKPVEPVRSHENTPNYLHDLNAMHEEEKVLTDEQRRLYTEHAMHILNDAMRETKRWLGATAFHYMHLTAAQRAEAFLRTLGKWTEA